MHRNLSNRSIEAKNISNRSIEAKNISNRSIEAKNNRSNDSIGSASRKRQDSSVERAGNAKAFMEDISNRVKNIEERVRLARMAMNNRVREEPRPQKPSDSYQKRYNLPRPSSRDKRDNSVKSR